MKFRFNYAEGASQENRPGEQRFSGRIKQLNFGLHGEVNGGILDSGDFIHLKPKGARAVDLAIGMNVEGQGTTKAMADGHLVIEVREVNGVSIENLKLEHHAQEGPVIICAAAAQRLNWRKTVVLIHNLFQGPSV